METMVLVKNTIKSILSYCKVSEFNIELHLNPFKWYYCFLHICTKDDINPGLICHIHGQLGPIGILIYIDDERW